MSKKLKQLLRIIVPLLFGFLILWLLYRNFDFDTLWSTLRSDANFWIIAGASLFGTFGNSFRGLRWHILNKSLGKGEARLIHSFLTTHGNYTVNMALPRLGEVWRCASMRHYTPGVSFSQLFGTLIVDRVFDVIVVGLIVLLAMVANFGFFRDFFSDNPDLLLTIEHLTHSPLFYIILLLIILGGIGLYLYMRRGGQNKLKEKLSKVGEGLQTVATMREKGRFYLYTVLIWLSYFLQFYITFSAFSFTAHLEPNVALLAFIMGTIAVAAPVQAGMGAWHFMVIYTLVVFGVTQEDASAFALIVHTFQTLWTTVVGTIAIFLLPLFPPRDTELAH